MAGARGHDRQGRALPRVLWVVDGCIGRRNRRGDECRRRGTCLEARSAAARAEGIRGGARSGVTLTPAVLLAAGTTALAAGLVVYALFPPARSLASRINPYLSPSGTPSRRTTAAGPLAAVFGPMFRSL